MNNRREHNEQMIVLYKEKLERVLKRNAVTHMLFLCNADETSDYEPCTTQEDVEKV